MTDENKEVPKGYRSIRLLVPEHSFKGEDIIKGEGLKLCDKVQAEALRQEMKRLQTDNDGHLEELKDAEEELLLTQNKLDEWWRKAVANDVKLDEMKTELTESKAYADKLVEGLPCLPKDVEVLRQANESFAEDVDSLTDLLANERMVVKTLRSELLEVDDKRQEAVSELERVLAGFGVREVMLKEKNKTLEADVDKYANIAKRKSMKIGILNCRLDKLQKLISVAKDQAKKCVEANIDIDLQTEENSDLLQDLIGTLIEYELTFMKDEEIIGIMGENIVNDIVSDLTGRGGLGNSFEECDLDIQDEIKDTWAQIVRDHIAGCLV